MDNRNQMHPEDMQNLLAFLFLSLLLWVSYDTFILKPKVKELKQAKAVEASIAQENPEAYIDLSRTQAVSKTKRISIENDSIVGSLNLVGARIDDISLKNYFRTIEKEEEIHVLSPSQTAFPRYIELGWVADSSAVTVPGKQTRWVVKGNADLRPNKPVTLQWTNPQNIIFERTFTIDDQFLITVMQKVLNKGSQTITMFPYALVTEHGLPENYFPRWIVHEGPIGFVGEELLEFDFKKIEKKKSKVVEADKGWIGIAEKYWLSALIPEQGSNAKYRFIHAKAKNPKGKDKYQVDITGQALTLKPGDSSSVTTHVFAGAKKVSTLESYEKSLDVPHLDLAVDFGLFYFLTRPFFFVINLFYQWVGNFGIAIILLTICLRLAVFPLANTSFRSFAKLRQVGPQMYELREKYGDDKQKLQQELVKLYQKEKVNPMAGCLPILVQIPIFFALFKVLSNTIEMRHQPFFGWIQDLSEPDPTSFVNLFGLLPFDPPGFLVIGIWPCLMLVSMLAQRRLSPPIQDPLQAKIIAAMPYVIVFILAKFAAGLVIYWTFNNILSIVQQYVIMRRMGVKVSFFGKNDETQSEENKKPEDNNSDSAHNEEEQEEESKPEISEISMPKPKKKKKKKT